LAASQMNAGVSKSGSPAPRSMIVFPSAFSALARCETAIVTDYRSRAMFGEGVNASDMGVRDEKKGANEV